MGESQAGHQWRTDVHSGRGIRTFSDSPEVAAHTDGSSITLRFPVRKRCVRAEDMGDGDGLDFLGRITGRRSFALIEFLFLLVEGFLDVPLQPVDLAEYPG